MKLTEQYLLPQKSSPPCLAVGVTFPPVPSTSWVSGSSWAALERGPWCTASHSRTSTRRPCSTAQGVWPLRQAVLRNTQQFKHKLVLFTTRLPHETKLWVFQYIILSDISYPRTKFPVSDFPSWTNIKNTGHKNGVYIYFRS